MVERKVDLFDFLIMYINHINMIIIKATENAIYNSFDDSKAISSAYYFINEYYGLVSILVHYEHLFVALSHL